MKNIPSNGGSEMIENQSGTVLKLGGHGENYFFGCLGAAALMIGIAQWILGGIAPGWLPGGTSRVIGWAALIILQLLTLFALRRRLLFLRLTRLWVPVLVVLWIGFDLPLALSRHVYIALPLAYGISQIPLLLSLRKTD
jgi:hypothetical protein